MKNPEDFMSIDEMLDDDVEELGLTPAEENNPASTFIKLLLEVIAEEERSKDG